MTVFELIGKLTLDVSDYEKKLSDAVNEASTKSGLAASEIDKNVAKMQKGFAVAGAAAAAAIGAFAVSSVKTGMEFDSSMAQVAATMGKTVDEIGELRDFAQEMGKATVFSATQSAEALNYMALAGYDAETSMKMLPNVLNLAAAGSIDLARASDMITDTQTAFGMSLERTNQLVDEMAKAASTGNTSVEQLGDAFLVVGGLAKELNGGMVQLDDGTMEAVDGIQEMEIALTAMANAGIKGNEAGTHMRNMLLKLSSPTSDGTKQLEAMGVTVFDTEGKMRSLSDIFRDFSGAMESMTQEQKIQAISDLFNSRDIASAEALLGAVSQDWDNIGESILNAEGAAQKMADTQLDNLQGDITLLKSAFEGMKISISDDLTPAVRGFVQGLTGLIEKSDEIIPVILGAATAFGVFAVAVNISNIISAVTKAMAALNVVLLANPIGIVIALVAGLTVALVTAYKKSEKFRTIVQNAFAKVNAAAAALIGGIQKLWDKFKDFVDIGKNIVEGLWKGIEEKAQWVKDKVKGFVDKIKGIFTGPDGFDEHSPSKWAKKVGEFVMDGLAIGMDDGEDTVEKHIEDTLLNIKDTLAGGIEEIEKELERRQLEAQQEADAKELAEYKKSVDEKIAELKKEPGRRKEILEELSELQADWSEKEKQKARQQEEDILNQRLAALKEYQKQYEDAFNDLSNKQSNLLSKLQGYGSLFTKKDNMYQLDNLDNQIDELNKYVDRFEKLKDRGVSEGLLNEVLQMTVDDADGYMAKLLDMSDASLEQYVAKYEEKQALAAEISEKIYQTEFDKLNEAYEQNMPEALKGLFDAGVTMMDGLASGISDGESAVINAINQSITDAINSAKAAAGMGGGGGGSYGGGTSPSTTTQALTGIMNSMEKKLAREDAYASHTTVLEIDGKSIAKAMNKPLQSVWTQEGKTLTVRGSTWGL